MWFLKNILNLENSMSLAQNNFVEKLHICKSNFEKVSVQNNGVESMVV